MRHVLKLSASGVFALAACNSESPALKLASAVVVAEAQAEPRAVCRAEGSRQTLPSAVRESSGLAESRNTPGMFWTHNDAGNAPVIYAISSDGKLRSTVRVQGARLEDWEDISAGPCGSANCLFIGDIGDNDGRRRTITVYQVEEPAASATSSAAATALTARYPSGARDAEAMFVLAGKIFVVTKGREGPIELYRWPPGQGTASLQKVREILPRPRSQKDFVTSASASPDGRWIGIRTYSTLYLFPARALTGGAGAVSPIVTDLSSLEEAKGEGLALLDDGTVWLSSEAGGKKPPAIARMSCDLPA